MKKDQIIEEIQKIQLMRKQVILTELAGIREEMGEKFALNVAEIYNDLSGVIQNYGKLGMGPEILFACSMLCDTHELIRDTMKIASEMEETNES